MTKSNAAAVKVSKEKINHQKANGPYWSIFLKNITILQPHIEHVFLHIQHLLKFTL
jgi:hypothetical protein